jgi:hypothetical protein
MVAQPRKSGPSPAQNSGNRLAVAQAHRLLVGAQGGADESNKDSNRQPHVPAHYFARNAAPIERQNAGSEIRDSLAVTRSSGVEDSPLAKAD